jgi:hypothetical protein
VQLILEQAMEQLFGSKTRVKLLKMFMQNPNRSFYVREITRKIEEQINSVRRELANLLSIGIVVSKGKDNKLYYEVNQRNEHYMALRALFAGTKVEKSETQIVVETPVSKKIKELGSVETMAYMGYFTGENRTGTDVLIIGNVNRTKVNNFIADLEDEEDHEMRFTIMTPDEFNYRREINDRFISTVYEVKKSVIHDPNGLMSESAMLQPDQKSIKHKKKGK